MNTEPSGGTTSSTPEPIPFDRLQAVDLRNVSDERMRALKSEATRRRIPLQTLLSQIVEETARQILDADHAKHDPKPLSQPVPRVTSADETQSTATQQDQNGTPDGNPKKD